MEQLGIAVHPLTTFSEVAVLVESGLKPGLQATQVKCSL